MEKRIEENIQNFFSWFGIDYKSQSYFHSAIELLQKYIDENESNHIFLINYDASSTDFDTTFMNITNNFF